MLVHYDWPGNIRELRNMMERLALFLSVEPTPDLTPQFLQLLLPELARESSKTPAPRLLTPQQALEKFNGDKNSSGELFRHQPDDVLAAAEKLNCRMQRERFIRHKFQ
ncbi:Propionate catabolism operon regulatory protein [Escherichia coli]|uniref:Propionate catabolism operon regulatory protein n=1 Tax=Escherichia coli TaxID=562 RepID=A0A2X1KFS6_ECOLX|nr:Propionate catabolism operon regulatory protein [Escherichia coli]